MKPILSIVIPTKDRYVYLKDIISYVASINDGQIELVIQDNSKDNSEIMDYITAGNFEYVSYHHHVSPLSMVENFDLGIKKMRRVSSFVL